MNNKKGNGFKEAFDVFCAFVAVGALTRIGWDAMGETKAAIGEGIDKLIDKICKK